MAHSPELHSPVRALAHRLAGGRMAWVDYRNERAAAVEAIVNGDSLSYSRPVVFEETTQPKEHELSQNYIDVEALEREPRRWPAAVAVGALALTIIGAGWILWQNSRPPVVASAPVVVMSGAEAALAEFLAADDWSSDALAMTQADWGVYAADERAAARRTASWRRLQARLREEINRQRVLATVDETGEAAAQEARLMEFQKALQR